MNNIQPIIPSVTFQGAPNGNCRGVKGIWHKIKQEVSGVSQKVQQGVIDLFPNKTIEDGKFDVEKLEKYDAILSKPAENRLIVGATALATQPVIDYYNHKVDEETRTVSRNRTIAKIVAGTSVGILVRSLCYSLVEKMTDFNGTKKYSKWLLPDQFLNSIKDNPKYYKNTVSTLVALGVMCITNFLLDAPLTAYFTNVLNKKTLKQQKEEKSNLKEGLYV